MSIEIEENESYFEGMDPYKVDVLLWKLFQELKELKRKDSDSFRREFNDDTLMKVLKYDNFHSIYDEKTQKLKYGLEHSSIWKKIKEEKNYKYYYWWEDHNKWLVERLPYPDRKKQTVKDLQLIHNIEKTDIEIKGNETKEVEIKDDETQELEIEDIPETQGNMIEELNRKIEDLETQNHELEEILEQYKEEIRYVRRFLFEHRLNYGKWKEDTIKKDNERERNRQKYGTDDEKAIENMEKIRALMRAKRTQK